MQQQPSNIKEKKITMQIAAAVAQRSKGGGTERKKLDKTTVSLTHIAAATQKNKKIKNCRKQTRKTRERLV